MPTIPVTRELGRLLTKLRDGSHALAIMRGWSRLLLPQTGHTETVNHQMVKMLKKRGLIEPRPFDQQAPYSRLHWWHQYYRSDVYIISDAGKSFPLPPEEMWLEDE